MATSNIFYCLSNGLSQAFFIAPAPLTERNLPDQTGRVFLITGGYTGLGLALSNILYGANGTVWLAGRNESKANAAISHLQATHPTSTGALHFLSLDLSDLSSIKPAVQDFQRRNPSGKLHWLNNNAGIMVPPAGSRGRQGHDLTYVTNIYAPFLLTTLLLPMLRHTAATEEAEPRRRGTVRVSWAGSAASYLTPHVAGVAWEKDGKELAGALADPQSTYGISKAANWWLAVEFGRRFGDEDGVLHNSYNPGNLKTELQRTTKEVAGRIAHWFILNILCHPPVQGAYTELYAGLSQDLSLEKGDQGAWIVPWGQRSSMRPDMLAEAQKGEDGVGGKLWRWCEEVVKEYM